MCKDRSQLTLLDMAWCFLSILRNVENCKWPKQTGAPGAPGYVKSEPQKAYVMYLGLILSHLEPAINR